ncbi:hypothetical protein V8F20_001882 [Naviculisporaceae sp. PSN 640]
MDGTHTCLSALPKIDKPRNSNPLPLLLRPVPALPQGQGSSTRQSRTRQSRLDSGNHPNLHRMNKTWRSSSVETLSLTEQAFSLPRYTLFGNIPPAGLLDKIEASTVYFAILSYIVTFSLDFGPEPFDLLALWSDITGSKVPDLPYVDRMNHRLPMTTTNETISKIHETIGSFATYTSERDARLEKLEQNRKRHIQELETAFAHESSAIEGKRKAEKAAIAEQRKKEDEERERKRRLEDEEMELKAKKEDEERERAFERETAEVEDSTKTMKTQTVEDAQRKWEERNAKLKRLQEEMNRLINEQLQMPMPLPLSTSLEVAGKSPRNIPPLTTSASSSPAPGVYKTLESLPVAVIEPWSMSSTVVEAPGRSSPPASEKSNPSTPEMDMESSLETLPRTTYSPDLDEVSFPVPPVKTLPAAEVDKKEASEQAVAMDKTNALGIVPRPLPLHQEGLAADDAEAIAEMPELRRVSSRDPSAERHAQLGVDAGAKNNDESDVESQYDQEEESVHGANPRSASAELDRREQEQRKALEPAGDATARTPEDKKEQPSAKNEDFVPEVIQRESVLPNNSKRSSIVDEKPPAATQETAESSKRSSLVAETPSGPKDDAADGRKPSWDVADEESFATRELSSKTTGLPVLDAQSTEYTAHTSVEVMNTDRDDSRNAHGHSDPEAESDSSPDSKVRGDVGSFSPRPLVGDWPLRHNSVNLDEVRDMPRNVTPELKLDTDIFDKVRQAASVNESPASIERAQAAFESMISPTSTTERDSQTASAATPTSHIELTSKKVHDGLDIVESSPSDVISMGSPFERGSLRLSHATHEHDHSQLTADTSAGDVEAHSGPLDRQHKAAPDDGKDRKSDSDVEPAGESALQKHPQVEPAKKAVANAPEHNDSTSTPGSPFDSGGKKRVLPEGLKPLQKDAAIASASVVDDLASRLSSSSAEERTEVAAASRAHDPLKVVTTDVSNHDDVDERGSESGDERVEARSMRPGFQHTERTIFDAADSERPDLAGRQELGAYVDFLQNTADAHDAHDSDSDWGSEDDDVKPINPMSKLLSEELAQDDSSEDPMKLYDDDPLNGGSQEGTSDTDRAVQTSLASPPPERGETKDAAKGASPLPEKLSDEVATSERGGMEDNRDRVSTVGDMEKSSKPRYLSDELAHQGNDSSEGESMGYGQEDEPAKAVDLEADKNKKDAAVDIKTASGPELGAPPVAALTDKEVASDVEADAGAETVAPRATIPANDGVAPDLKTDAGPDLVAPAATISAGKDDVTEAKTHASPQAVEAIPAATVPHAEELADGAGHKPEALEAQPPVPTPERTPSQDVDATPVVRPEEVPLPTEDEDSFSDITDSEHADENAETEANKDTVTAAHNIEALKEAPVPTETSAVDNSTRLAASFTDEESREFSSLMASTGLRPASAEKEFLGKDPVDQGTTEAPAQGKEPAEPLDHGDSDITPAEQDLEKKADRRPSTPTEDLVMADKLDTEVEESDDEHDSSAAEDFATPAEAPHVPSTRSLSEHHPFYQLEDDPENEISEHAALNKVPTNETHSTNGSYETNEQDSNYGYPFGQHGRGHQEGHSATVHRQDDLFDSDEHNSAEDHDDTDRDSGDDRLDTMENPFRRYAQGDDLDDVGAVDSEDHLRKGSFEVESHLSVVERDAPPGDMTTASRGFSGMGDDDVNGTDDSDDDVRHDALKARQESPALQRNVQRDGLEEYQDERATPVSAETLPVNEHASSESKVDSVQDETSPTVETHQQDQQAPAVASPFARNIAHHEEDEDDYESDYNASEQSSSETIAKIPSTTDSHMYDMDARELQEVVLPESASPVSTRGLAASRHNHERDMDRPQTPEARTPREMPDQLGASSSPAHNSLGEHNEAEMDTETFTPRDVTNISWLSQAETPNPRTQSQPQSRSRRDTETTDMDVESTPMSLRSASTLSSAPSSPVHAALLSDNHEPVIRDSWPSHPAHGGHTGESSFSSRLGSFMSGSRPRGDSHLSNVSTSEYMGQDVPSGGKGSSFSLSPSPMRLWQRRDQGSADNTNTDTAYHRPVSAIDISTTPGRDESATATPTAASATIPSYRNSMTGSGPASATGGTATGTGTGLSLFQRMRNVFENNSSSGSATTPPAGGSRANSPVVRSRPGSFYRSLEQHQQEQLAAKRNSLVLQPEPADVVAAYDRGHSYDDGAGESTTCGYDEMSGYLHHEHRDTTKTSSSRGRERRRREEYYDDDMHLSDDDSGEDASLLEHGGGEYDSRGLRAAESGGLLSTRSSWAAAVPATEAERVELVKGEDVKLVNLRRIQVRTTAQSVVQSLETEIGDNSHFHSATAQDESALRPRIHSITSEIHVDNDNDNDDEGHCHYSLTTKQGQAKGDLRLPWIWVEGWRARLRMSGDVVEKSRWEWKMDDAPGIRQRERAGTVVSQIPSVVSVPDSGRGRGTPTPTGRNVGTRIGMSHAAHRSDPGPGLGAGSGSSTRNETQGQTQMQRVRAATSPGVFGSSGAQIVDQEYRKEENRPRRKSVRWASILG